MIVDADLSAIEWKVAAFLSQDPVILKEISEGVDQHADNCVNVLKLELTKENRNLAKVLTFRSLYGGGAYAFFKDPRMPSFSLGEWENICEAFWRKYKRLGAWQDEVVRQVTSNGTWQTPTGRMLAWNKTSQHDGSMAYSRPAIVNYPVQSVAGDVNKLFSLILRKRLKEAGVPLRPFVMFVHDSTILDVPEKYVDKVVHECYHIFRELDKHISNYWGIDWNVPLAGEVAVGSAWGTVKTIDNPYL